MSNQRLGQSRTPVLSEVLSAVVEKAISDLYVCLPGKIEKYNSATQLADIKPLLKKSVIDEEGNEIEEGLPNIPSVPIVFPRSGDFFLSFPLKKGDNVLLLFCDRSIDSFIGSSGSVDTDPVDLRQHDITDAVAIPGFFGQLKSIKDSISSGIVLGKERGVQVRCTGNDVEITSNGLTASIGGYVAMSTLCDILWSTFYTMFSSWAPVPQDGGAALKTAFLAAFPSPPSSVASKNLKAD